MTVKLTTPQLTTLRYIAGNTRGAWMGAAGTVRALIDRGLVTERISITEQGRAVLAEVERLTAKREAV